MSVMHDFRCEACGDVREHGFVPSGTQAVRCYTCGEKANKVFLTAPKPHWAALAQGPSASPEAIDRFERSHKQQRDKELRSMREHGDYGPAPGGSGGNRTW